MTTVASLAPGPVLLVAGEERSVPVEIRNSGPVVEQYTLSVVGAPADWATIDSPSMALYPGTAGVANIAFRPPRVAKTAAGEHEFAVKVMPSEHPEHVVVPEGTIEILPFHDIGADLMPSTSQGRRGRYQLALRNKGNVASTVAIEPRSDSHGLRFRPKRDTLVLPRGETRIINLRAKAARPLWRGIPRTHPFTVQVSGEESSSVAVEGVFVQSPVIPKWVLWLLPLALGLAALLAALWLLVLRPAIESQAQEAAEDSAQAAEQAAAEAEKQAENANEAAKTAEDSAEEDNPEDPGADKRRGRYIESDQSYTLHTAPGPHRDDSDSVTLSGTRDALDITDIVLSNPQGDYGRVRIVVDGEVKYDFALENFRDLPLTLVTPIPVNESVGLRVHCRLPGTPPGAPPAGRCDVSAHVGGELNTWEAKPKPDHGGIGVRR